MKGCMVPGCARITVAEGEALAFCLVHHNEYRAAHPDAEMWWTHEEFGDLCVERVMLATRMAELRAELVAS